MKAWTLAV